MLLETLKIQTRPRRARLERIKGLRATRAGYVRLLGRLHGLMAPWGRCPAGQEAEGKFLREGRFATRCLSERFGLRPWVEEVRVTPGGGQRVAQLGDARRFFPVWAAESLAAGVGVWAIGSFAGVGRWISSLRVVSRATRSWHAVGLAVVEAVLARMWPLVERARSERAVAAAVSRTELPMVPVELETLVEGIVESYPQFHPEHADVVVLGPLPRVLGNEAALMQCVSNLLGDAVKFVAPGVRPRAEIVAESVGGCARLFVSDNGIGIGPGARDKIFGIFERFHSGYEGTGIGRTVVRRAMERMGGAASFDSEPGRGSRFCLEPALAP